MNAQNGRTALAARPAEGSALAMWDRDQISVIKTLICPGASDTELALFGQVCQRTGLDPFARQIYGIMRGGRKQVNGEWRWVESLSIQTSIDGFRLIAERSNKYGGQLGPQWCGMDGQWRDVWLSDDYPAAARVGVIRVDWKEPLWAVARWSSYVQTHKDKKSGDDVVSVMWARMPDVMLAKVAESLALRRAFPAELSGLYTAEEMAQADREPPAPEPRTIPPELTGVSIREKANARMVVQDGIVVKDREGPKRRATAEDVARADVVIVDGKVVDRPEPSAADRARAAAMVTGADPAAARRKEKAPPTREQLVAKLEAGIARARALGSDVEMPDDLEAMSTEDIHETVKALATMVRDVEAAQAASADDDEEAPF